MDGTATSQDPDSLDRRLNILNHTTNSLEDYHVSFCNGSVSGRMNEPHSSVLLVSILNYIGDHKVNQEVKLWSKILGTP